MSRQLHRHLSKNWNLTETESITTLPLKDFSEMTPQAQREYLTTLKRLGYLNEATKYTHHLKKKI